MIRPVGTFFSDWATERDDRRFFRFNEEFYPKGCHHVFDPNRAERNPSHQYQRKEQDEIGLVDNQLYPGTVTLVLELIGHNPDCLSAITWSNAKCVTMKFHIASLRMPGMSKELGYQFHTAEIRSLDEARKIYAIIRGISREGIAA